MTVLVDESYTRGSILAALAAGFSSKMQSKNSAAWSTPNHGTPSGAARAKRIARKRKSIRARRKK